MLSSTLRKISKAIVFLFLLITGTWTHAAITDIKFSQYQIADSQWNVSACLNTTTCQIYSKNPGTAYKIPWTSGQVQWAAGDYVQFELSGNASFPYIAKQYSSNGTLKSTLGTGKIVNMGPDYFFFVGNDNNTGQLFSGSSGMSDTSGVTWTGTLNPTLAEADAYAANNYSTTPLAAGETAGPPPPPPTPVYSSTITSQQASRRSSNLADTSGNNIDITITGNSNTVEVEQRGAGHYLELAIIGNNNSFTGQQLNDSGPSRHYQETSILSDSNTIGLLQSGSGSKTAFVVIDGSLNRVEIVQSGSGSHFLDFRLGGNDHDIEISQIGEGNHSATVDLSQGTGSWTFVLEQSGSVPQTYSLPHSLTDGTPISGVCNSAAGCSLTVYQN